MSQLSRIMAMAMKDLLLLSRDKLGAFFIIGFPVLMGLFFGLIMGSSGSSGSSRIPIAVIDQDQSESSQRFVKLLRENENLELLDEDFDEDLDRATERVRKGSLVGALVVPKGFGERSKAFWGESPTIQLAIDPSRSAEAGMIEGMVMQATGRMMQDRFSNPDLMRPQIDEAIAQAENSPSVSETDRGLMKDMFASLDSMFDSIDRLNANAQGGQQPQTGGGFQLAQIESLDVTRQIDPGSTEAQTQKLKSRWDISFPQAMLWGVLGCVAGFAVSIARERTGGTMTRLHAAPISRFDILAGKAVACFITVVFVVTFMTILGIMLGMQPGSYVHLILATLATAFCFVGIMMTLSVLGKTEQSVAGSGWAINMIMAMIGGCMIPMMFMPSFLQKVSVVSPVRWAISAIEGAIWREFSFSEMLTPCGVLIGFGVSGIVLGTFLLQRRNDV